MLSNNSIFFSAFVSKIHIHSFTCWLPNNVCYCYFKLKFVLNRVTKTKFKTSKHCKQQFINYVWNKYTQQKKKKKEEKANQAEYCEVRTAKTVNKQNREREKETLKNLYI